MSDDTPSGAPPIPEARQVRTRNEKTGYDDLNTISNNDAPGKKTRVSIAESIGTTTANVTTEGAVTAKTLEGGKVRVESGWAKMIADVALKPDVDPDPPHFRIGWVQTLLSSRRVGVYKTAKGDTISRIQDTGKVSDRREYWGDPTKPRAQVAAPWYDLPEELGTEHRKIHIHAFDKAGFALAPTLTEEGSPFHGAKLVAIQGGESFLTSLKAGDNGQHTLKTWQWAIPWEVNVDGIAKDARSGGKMAPATVTTADNQHQEGPTAITTNHSDVLEAYGSVDAAMQKLQTGYSSFVALLAKHRTAAPESYWNMVGALWKSDAQLRVRVMKGKEALGKDVRVGFKANGDLAANQGGKDGTEFTLLARMMLDPGGGMATPLAISLNGSVVMTVAAPYHGIDAPAKITMPGMFGGEEAVTVKFSIS